jgi:hypothetical protein
MKHKDKAMDMDVAKKAAKQEVKRHVDTMHAKGGKVKIRGTGAAKKGIYARGPMA